MNVNIMNVEELRENYMKCIMAVRNENYQEALRIHHLIYESSYKEYKELLDKRKKVLTDEEKLRLDNRINSEFNNLEKMAKHALIIKELNFLKVKNEPK